jgi:hypothetical protein
MTTIDADILFTRAERGLGVVRRGESITIRPRAPRSIQGMYALCGNMHATRRVDLHD